MLTVSIVSIQKINVAYLTTIMIKIKIRSNIESVINKGIQSMNVAKLKIDIFDLSVMARLLISDATCF